MKYVYSKGGRNALHEWGVAQPQLGLKKHCSKDIYGMSKRTCATKLGTSNTSWAAWILCCSAAAAVEKALLETYVVWNIEAPVAPRNSESQTPHERTTWKTSCIECRSARGATELVTSNTLWAAWILCFSAAARVEKALTERHLVWNVKANVPLRNSETANTHDRKKLQVRR